MSQEMTLMKAEISAGATALLGFVNIALHELNKWFNDLMPLISGSCMIITALAAVWYYARMDRHKTRDRALEHKRLEQERELHNRRHDDPKEEPTHD